MDERLDRKQIAKCLAVLANQYKSDLRPRSPTADGPDVSRVCRLYRKGGVLVDLGGGISVHNGVLAELGMSVYVVDLLSDYWEHRATEPITVSQEIQLLEACGVQFIHGDVSTYDLTTRFPHDSVDVVTSFQCLEHLHQSPKPVLESAMRVLKPGGLLRIEVPNAANIRKRVALLMGYTNYPAFNAFYYSSPWVGHVREYTIGDLHQLARNIGAKEYRIFGKNTMYVEWAERIPPRIRGPLDAGLQFFPGLCSVLLLEVTKA